MNKLIKNKFNLILSIFILLHPIIDLITGICLHVFKLDLTFGNVIRILFLIFIMFSTIFVYKKQKIFWYYLIVLLYSIMYFVGIIITKNGFGMFLELQGLIRTFYFPIILLSLYLIRDNLKINIKILSTTLCIYIICIFFPYLLGLGYQSYEITKLGTLGFYNSANEISGIISILTPVAIITFKDKKHLLLKLLLTLIYLVVIFIMGTKTPILSLLIIIGMLWLWIIIKFIKDKKYKPIVYSSLFILAGIISIVIIAPKTNFYKNIKVHLDYLEVDNIFDIVKDEELIDHFVFSQRLTFWNNRENEFEDVGVYQKLIGMGYLQKKEISKTVEMDYIDVYYSHGIIGFVIFFSAYLYVIVSIFKTKEKITFERYMFLTSFILIAILSLLTGHIIIAPAVSLIATTTILCLEKRVVVY